MNKIGDWINKWGALALLGFIFATIIFICIAPFLYEVCE